MSPLTLTPVTPGSKTLTAATQGSLTLPAASSLASTAVYCSEMLACSSTLACGEGGIALQLPAVNSLSLATA